MRMLDLYCGEGLAAWGYWLSGRFGEIVGVDINPKMRRSYSFNFVCADAFRLDYDFLMSFDFIHASPPCQAYSTLTPDQSKHERLIAGTHLMLVSAGKPYVIENVEGSSFDLKPNVVMDGFSVGLPIQRRRYFHASTLAMSVRLMSAGRGIHLHGESFVNRQTFIKAMGLDVINKNRLRSLTVDGMKQGVPPAMTKLLAEMLFPDYKAMIA